MHSFYAPYLINVAENPRQLVIHTGYNCKYETVVSDKLNEQKLTELKRNVWMERSSLIIYLKLYCFNTLWSSPRRNPR